MMKTKIEEMTWPEIARAIREKRPLIFIVGSIEQHGPHLPVNTDLVIPYEIAQRLAESVGAVVAPPVAYGYKSKPKSGGGEGFPGTFSLNGETLIHVVRDLITAYIKKGFGNILVLDWHIENVEFINEGLDLALTATEGTERKIVVVDNPNGLVDQEILDDLFQGDFPGWEREHAAIFETSMMLALCPELVRKEQIADDESPAFLPYDILPAPKDVVPESGVLWHATKADEEKGKRAVESMVSALARIVEKELRI